MSLKELGLVAYSRWKDSPWITRDPVSWIRQVTGYAAFPGRFSAPSALVFHAGAPWQNFRNVQQDLTIAIFWSPTKWNIMQPKTLTMKQKPIVLPVHFDGYTIAAIQPWNSPPAAPKHHRWFWYPSTVSSAWPTHLTPSNSANNKNLLDSSIPPSEFFVN